MWSDALGAISPITPSTSRAFAIKRPLVPNLLVAIESAVPGATELIGAD
jgi:hypothetical protein